MEGLEPFFVDMLDDEDDGGDYGDCGGGEGEEGYGGGVHGVGEGLEGVVRKRWAGWVGKGEEMGEGDGVKEVGEGNLLEKIEDGFVGRWDVQKRNLWASRTWEIYSRK